MTKMRETLVTLSFLAFITPAIAGDAEVALVEAAYRLAAKTVETLLQEAADPQAFDRKRCRSECARWIRCDGTVHFSFGRI